MKNTKQPRSAPSRSSSRGPFRPFAAAGAKSRRDESVSSGRGEDRKTYRSDKVKPRRSDEAKPRRYEEDTKTKPFYKGEKSKSSFRSSEKPKYGEKPRFGDKPKFGDKSKVAFRKPRPEQRDARVGSKPRPEQREIYKPAGDGVLIWGLHAARAAWLNPKRRITRAWLSESGQKLFAASQKEALEELLKRPDAKQVDRDELDRLTPPNSVHQGIVIETSPLIELALHEIISANPPPDLILMLDQVTDPHNVGAILRSAAAFGAGAIIMTERNAPTTTGVLAKSASGALENTPMVHVVNLARTLDELREAGYWCVGLAEEGEKNIGELDLSGRTVLVLGAEGEGLRHLTRQKCDELARLPTGNAMGSLNVSNAAAVALYEVRRQAK